MMDDPWLPDRRDACGGVRLFCFPYAGGSYGIYSSWQRRFPRNIEVCAVELPGRVSRAHEAPVDRLEPLVDALLRALARHWDGPFAFFGYSMGALIAFELARRLMRAQLRAPIHLFVAACPAPQLATERVHWSRFSDGELLTELQRRYRPLPSEVLADPGLMSVILPMLRADLQLSDEYRCTPGSPLRCPLTAFGGTHDSAVTPAELAAWAENTSGTFDLQQFEGDHFFLETQRDSLLRAIGRRLTLASTSVRLG
jgi:medium-chain acyl-[acyl-carrier-protein] hydrolase